MKHRPRDARLDAPSREYSGLATLLSRSLRNGPLAGHHRRIENRCDVALAEHLLLANQLDDSLAGAHRFPARRRAGPPTRGTHSCTAACLPLRDSLAGLYSRLGVSTISGQVQPLDLGFPLRVPSVPPELRVERTPPVRACASVPLDSPPHALRRSPAGDRRIGGADRDPPRLSLTSIANLRNAARSPSA